MNPRESAFEMQMCNCQLRLLLHRDLCMCVHVSPSARACVRVCGPSGGKRVGWLFSCGSELAHIPREIHPGCSLNVGHVRLKLNFSVTSQFSSSSSTPSCFFSSLLVPSEASTPELLCALSAEEEKKKDVEVELERA